MSRGAATFREADLTRALRAAKKADYALSRIEITRDEVVLFPGEPEHPAKLAEGETDEWATPE